MEIHQQLSIFSVQLSLEDFSTVRPQRKAKELTPIYSVSSSDAICMYLKINTINRLPYNLDFIIKVSKLSLEIFANLCIFLHIFQINLLERG